MRAFACLVVLLACTSALCFPQEAEKKERPQEPAGANAAPKKEADKPRAVNLSDKRIPRAASIYIEEMEHDLDGYIKAEMIKKKVPLQIVLKPEDADLVMIGSSTEEERRKWHEGWLTVERDKTAGNVQIINRRTNEFLWASEAGDRSIWWGALKRGGHRKVADRLVSKLKKAIAP